MKTDNSIAFFEHVKAITEAEWEHIDLNDPFSSHILPGSKWKPGLSEKVLQEFEVEMGFTFPEPLRNFYRTMNGLDRARIYTDEDNNPFPYYQFYSYPEHLDKIRSQIEWIYESNRVTLAILKARAISRIFPIWGHRFIMIDEPGHPVLSMHGRDIIFYGLTLGSSFLHDHLHYASRRKCNEPVVPFWYPGWNKGPQMPKCRHRKGMMTKWNRKMKMQVIMQHRTMG